MPEHNQGPPGPQGPVGLKGTRGDKGHAGADANPTVIRYIFSTVLPASLPRTGYIPTNWEGEGMPSAAIHVKSGESVVNAADNSMWTYLTDSGGNNWRQATVLSGDVKGTQGQKGEEGEKGATGDAGEKGLKGFGGLQGVRGLPGQKGQIGVAGSTGSKGEKGIPGPTGEKGLSGTNGVDGVNGIEGSTGPQGPRGHSGVDGVDGEKGDMGPAGSDGISPNPIQLPKFMCSYNGERDLVTAHHNLDKVDKLGVGVYRFRFGQKLYAQRGMVFVTAYGEPTLDYGNHRFATVVAQTDWTVTVKVEDPAAEQRADAYVSIVLYLPN